MIEAVRSRVVGELEKIVGARYVSTNPADLYIYSQDMTQAEPGWPDAVALPKTVGEIQAIVKLANREKVPVIPYLAGGNIGGLTIPLRGGITLDLKANNQRIKKPTLLSTPESRVQVWGIPTNEELAIARETKTVIAGPQCH